MASRNFYVQLIFKILLIAATCLLLAFSISHQWWMWLGFSTIFLITQTYFLIRFINGTNRKIAYFFDAIKNEDFTLRFPEKVSIKSFKELNQSLNRVNNLIQEVHLQLQIRENYYQEILKQAKIGIMTYNNKGHILFSNPTLENLFNHSPLNHIRQLAKLDEQLYSLFNSYESFERKLFQLTNEREQKQLALKSTPITLGDQSLLLVVVQDIHHELDEKETESWIRLIRVLTHEIMNTITPITSISESILKYYQTDDKTSTQPSADKVAGAIKGLEVINEQSNDLMEFVQSYRSFLNVPKPEKELVQAQKLFEKVEILTRLDLGNGIDVVWKVDPADLELFVDEKQLTQVLLNLVKNAFHALESMEGGKIEVSGAIDEIGRKIIEVKDNGPGISEELIDEIFVPFFTTKENGSGIGLSLSKQIMHLHGGDLKVHSKPNKETSFLLNFQ